MRTRVYVCPSMDSQQQTRCCKFATVGPAGRCRSTAARPTVSSSGVWMRVVPRCQRTYEAEHRRLSFITVSNSASHFPVLFFSRRRTVMVPVSKHDASWHYLQSITARNVSHLARPHTSSTQFAAIDLHQLHAANNSRRALITRMRWQHQISWAGN